MEDRDRAVVLLAQPPGDLLGHDDRPVKAAGAADGDGQPGLPLADICRDGERQELLEVVQEASRHRLREDEGPDRVGQTGLRSQLGVVVGVLHESDVEHQVGLERDPELEPEADELECELIRTDVGCQRREQALAQLAKRQVRGVEHDVGVGADCIEAPPLLGDRVGDAAVLAERMTMTGLAVAPDQDVVASLEEDDPWPDPATLERAAHGCQGKGRVASAHVEDDGDPCEAGAITRDELGQVRQELARQVVHDRVAEVLEELRRRRLAPARQPADDDDRGLGHPVGGWSDLAVGGHLPLRLMNRSVSSNRMYIVLPRTIGLTMSPPGVTTAAKIEMPRMIIRREPLSRSDVTIPTRDRPTSRIGNSMINPNTRNSVVTKSKYGPAAGRATSLSSVKLNRNAIAYGRMKYAMATPIAKNSNASGIHGRTVRRSVGVSPGATNAQTW